MGVSHVTPDGSGGYWGWDDQANDWVPVDAQAYEGSTVGNLARGASRSLEGIATGALQLAEPGNPNVAAAAALQAQQRGEAAAGAPIAEMVGGSAPDVLAGILAGAATGGTSLPLTLAAQALAGASTAAIRPGSIEERLNAAMLGGAAGLGGEVIGQAAAKGIGLALQLGRGISARSAATTARAVETGAIRADTRRAADLATGEPAPGGSTAGAAQAPASAETEALAREGDLIEQSQGYGGMSDNKARQAYAPAEAYGYQAPSFEGAPRGSKAMLNAALDEFNPFNSSFEEARRIGNQQLVNRAYAKAAGMTLDINDQAFNQVDITDMGRMLDHLEQGFEEVEGEMAPIPVRALQKALNKISDRRGYAEPTRAETVLTGVKDRINSELTKNPHVYQDPGGFIGDLRRLQQAAVQAAKDGDQESAMRLNQAVNLYYDTAERATKQMPHSSGRARDEGIVSKGWKELRDEYRMYMMGNSPGVWGSDGTINGTAIFRKMRQNPVNGGWGSRGPEKGTNARVLWDIARAHSHETTALGRTPATGVRLSRDIGKIARNTAITSLGAGAGLGIVNKLWD